MSSVNKVILVGRLGADPELRYTTSGTAVCSFRVATNRVFTGRDGQRKEEVAWHRIVAWGKQGETCKSFLGRGRQVFVEGRLRQQSYTDKEGQRRFSTEVVADRVVFLGGGGRAEPVASGETRSEEETAPPGGGRGAEAVSPIQDEIPF